MMTDTLTAAQSRALLETYRRTLEAAADALRANPGDVLTQARASTARAMYDKAMRELAADAYTATLF